MSSCRLKYGRSIVRGVVPIVCLVALGSTGGSSQLTPFVPTVVLPQQAVGDFDGDGRVDVARIQHGVRGTSITVHLSDSAVTTQLDANVTALVEHDIDHDGDLDLVATSPSGAVLVWINDGHGEFTQEVRSRTSHVASQAALVQTGQTALAIIAVQTVALPQAWARRQRLVTVTRIRPPTVDRVSRQAFGLLPAFRAPPSIHS